MLQHVGLIKPEEMITERAFRRRFSDQLQRYSLLTTVGSIVNLVSRFFYIVSYISRADIASSQRREFLL